MLREFTTQSGDKRISKKRKTKDALVDITINRREAENLNQREKMHFI
jgi:uncharacterized protein YjiS (DUF1127 family)